MINPFPANLKARVDYFPWKLKFSLSAPRAERRPRTDPSSPVEI
jgi:hypothetical protein